MARRLVAYQDEPYTDPQIDFYVRAWHALQSCRQIGMDVGPVPATAIDSWTAHRHLDQEASMLVEYVIRYVEAEHAREAAATKARETARPGARR